MTNLPRELVIDLPDIEATERFGSTLAETLPISCVVALSGTLGAGKTRLVQAIAGACGIDPSEVTSPTFVLCREYRAQRHIFHLDAYRLKEEEEFLELGPEEMFAAEALVIIEWADRVQSFLPMDRLEIQLEIAGETARRAILKSDDGAKFSLLWDRLS